MCESNQIIGIYLGDRGKDFKNFIISILKKGKITAKYINMLTDTESMLIYGSAFTSELVDPDNNYQVLEQLGDLASNKFINNYMYDRFPQLDCTQGVAVVARLRINYGSKNSFSDIAQKFGFWKFISATNELRQRKMKPLLEDVFEAFIGATERIIDRRKRVGVGYAIVYDILASIFDDMNISLAYEDLYDAKTRLKELFDLHESSLGPLVYKDQRHENMQSSTVYRVQDGKYEEKTDSNGNITINKNRINNGKYIKIGEGSACLKSDAQQNAAMCAITFLSNQGWTKPIPKIYQKFNSNSEAINKETIIKKYGPDINSLQYTKDKHKYQNKYQSTPLTLYCRSKSVQGVSLCMSLGSDPNIQDTDGMFATDILLIGKIDNIQTIKDILTLMITNKKLHIHKYVFDTYFTQNDRPEVGGLECFKPSLVIID